MLSRLTTLLIFMLTLSSQLQAQDVNAESWLEFRGAKGQGRAATDKAVPIKWDTGGENIKWKAALEGVGWSSPVILGNQIWMTAARAEELSDPKSDDRLQGKSPIPRTAVDNLSLRAICVDRESGKVVHDIELLTHESPDPIHVMNSYASPTPAIETGRVYCHFGSYGTVCIETNTGEIVWSNSDLKVDHATGPGSSPILWNNLVIFSHDGMDRQSIVALDKSSGKVAWRTDRSGEMNSNPQLKKAYGTPIVLTLDGKATILSNAANWLYAYDPASGEELWRVEYGMLGFSNVPLLLIQDDMVYVCTGFMKSELQAFKLKGRDEAPELVWRFRKQVPAVTSPLLVDGRIYFVSDNGGVLTCVDAKSGDKIWQDRIEGTHAASPTYAAGHIYLPNRQGETVVIKAGGEFQKVATNKLESPILATPAIVDGAIYLRTEKALMRIESKPAT